MDSCHNAVNIIIQNLEVFIIKRFTINTSVLKDRADANEKELQPFVAYCGECGTEVTIDDVFFLGNLLTLAECSCCGHPNEVDPSDRQIHAIMDQFDKKGFRSIA